MYLRHKQMTSSEKEKKYDCNRLADVYWQTSPQMPVDVVGCMWPCGSSSDFLFKTYSVYIICDQSKLPRNENIKSLRSVSVPGLVEKKSQRRRRVGYRSQATFVKALVSLWR
jgi:hypothetical protein